MKKEIEINLTPDTLAEMFVGWSNVDQGEFFNLVGKHFKFSDFDSELQCCYISDAINKNGKDFLFTLANFVKASKLPPNSPHIDTLLNVYKCDSLRGDR